MVDVTSAKYAKVHMYFVTPKAHLVFGNTINTMDNYAIIILNIDIMVHTKHESLSTMLCIYRIIQHTY